MKHEIEMLSDIELSEMAIAIARALSYEGPEVGWDFRWISELLAGDIDAVGILTPVTCRRALTLILRGRKEYIRGVRAKRDGLPIEACPHSCVMAELDHFVEFDGVNWKNGWRSTAGFASESSACRTVTEKQSVSDTTLSFSDTYCKRVKVLLAQYPGLELAVAQGVGMIVTTLAEKQVRNPERVREQFLYESYGTPAMKILYRTDGHRVHILDIRVIAMQPPMF